MTPVLCLLNRLLLVLAAALHFSVIVEMVPLLRVHLFRNYHEALEWSRPCVGCWAFDGTRDVDWIDDFRRREIAIYEHDAVVLPTGRIIGGAE